VVVKDPIRIKGTVAEMGRWILRAFQFDVELDG